jgi:hypothetical protein
MTTYKSTAVISIVMVTAIPYAAASAVDDHDDGDRREHERPVHLRDVHLADFARRRVLDVQAGAVSELNGLAGERERAGDQRLRGDDRGRCGDCHERQQRPLGGEQKEGLRRGLSIDEQQRSLTEVVEEQGRQNEPEPGHSNRPPAEVTHVGIQRLAAGHDQKDRAEHRHTVKPMLSEEHDCVPGIDRFEDDRFAHDPHDAQCRNRNEPEHHDRPEKPADPVRAIALNAEDDAKDSDRYRNDIRFEERRGDFQAFDRTKHGDGGRDHAIAVQEGRPEQSEQHQRRVDRSAAFARRQQCRERQDPALAVVVGAHDDGDVLDRDDDQQRVDDERQDAEHVFVGGRHGMRAEEALAQRIQRTGADVAVHDSQGRESKRQRAA